MHRAIGNGDRLGRSSCCSSLGSKPPSICRVDFPVLSRRILRNRLMISNEHAEPSGDPVEAKKPSSRPRRRGHSRSRKPPQGQPGGGGSGGSGSLAGRPDTEEGPWQGGGFDESDRPDDESPRRPDDPPRRGHEPSRRADEPSRRPEAPSRRSAIRDAIDQVEQIRETLRQLLQDMHNVLRTLPRMRSVP
jgi:hypothetical protein